MDHKCLYGKKLTYPNSNNDAEISFIFYFYLYIYPPDSQDSDGGAIRRVSNYPDLLPEIPRYYCPLVIY